MLGNLDFGSIINSVKPITESGTELLKNYKGYVYNNPVSYGLVNSFIKEAQNYRFDTGIAEALSTVLEFVTDNKVSWQLATACENLSGNHRSYDYLSNNAIKQVEKILEMKEQDVIQYIKAGALKNVQYVTEFRNICKSVFNESVKTVNAINYNLTTPISYVEVREGKSYFSVGGKVFTEQNGLVKETYSPSKTFDTINLLLEYATRSNSNLVFCFEPKNINFTINENKVIVTRDNKIEATLKNTKQLLEWCDTASRGFFNANKVQFMNFCRNMITVFENMDHIVELDNVHLLETVNGTKEAIVEGGKNTLVNVFAGPTGKATQTFNTILEGLQFVEKTSGVNLQEAYENSINESIRTKKNEQIKESLTEARNFQINRRRARIEALTEQYKNDPVRLAVLNKMAKDLALLEDEEISTDTVDNETEEEKTYSNKLKDFISWQYGYNITKKEMASKDFMNNFISFMINTPFKSNEEKLKFLYDNLDSGITSKSKGTKQDFENTITVHTKDGDVSFMMPAMHPYEISESLNEG